MDLALIVDSDLIQRTLLREILSAYSNLVVMEAKDGRQALQMVYAEQPTLVLLELRLEGLDGLEVCRLIKAVPGPRPIAVIIITSDTNELKGRSTGCDEYVVKPYDTNNLEAIVSKLLDATIK